MAKRLRMTEADYVAIAVSPALVMMLVGSLVFFLIEVLYVGDYENRLNYVFALFVFATVLIARIAIEMGSELAAMYSLPLGIVTFLALAKFVEHPSRFSPLINIGLLAAVWWSCHKLTWDSTLIDDNEDASGEGLLGQMGVDESQPSSPPPAATKTKRASRRQPPATPSKKVDNELFDDAKTAAKTPGWFQRIFQRGKRPHTPGLWVLYFSLAALPLFGVGQYWVPASDAGRRRYAFGLLAVYVFAALALLVTTSFLALRRYLRQRNVEMPGPMAATWVALGGVLIVLVMFAAALIPRPSAEYALAQPPWQAGSPDGLTSSPTSVGGEGADDEDPENGVADDKAATPGNAVDDQPHEAKSSTEGSKSSQSAQGEQGNDKSPQGEQGSSGPPNENETSNSPQRQQGQQESSPRNETPGEAAPPNETPAEPNNASSSEKPPARQPPAIPEEVQSERDAEESRAHDTRAFRIRKPPAAIVQAAHSLGDIFKYVFYALGAIAILYLMWNHRHRIMQAMADILTALRNFFARLFGGAAAVEGQEDEGAAAHSRRRTFAEFNDPFATGRHRQLPPVELVRYTFEAFEAWAGDHGSLRTPDQTPHELVQTALAPQTPMYDEARRLARLYGEAAYAGATVPREAADSLQTLWRMMRAAGVREASANVRTASSAAAR